MALTSRISSTTIRSIADRKAVAKDTIQDDLVDRVLFLPRLPSRKVPNGGSSVSTRSAAIRDDSIRDSLVLRMQLVSKQAEAIPDTEIPQQYFVYQSSFDLEDLDDAERFSAALLPKSAEGPFTYKTPLLPSVVEVSGAYPNTVKSVHRPKHLRFEAKYIAQVADRLFGTVTQQQRDGNLPFQDTACGVVNEGQDTMESTLTASCLTMKRACLVLNEAARLIHPMCRELGSLLLAAKYDLLMMLSTVTGLRQSSHQDLQRAETRIKEQDSLIDSIQRQVDALKAELESIRASQLSESQRFAKHVIAAGFTPAIAKSVPSAESKLTVNFSGDQINAIATVPHAPYIFSPERVVPGDKVFVRHPRITNDVAVDCTDLYFERNSSHSPAAEATPSPQPGRIEFSGSAAAFVRTVQRVMTFRKAGSELAKGESQSVSSTAEDPTPSAAGMDSEKLLEAVVCPAAETSRVSYQLPPSAAEEGGKALAAHPTRRMSLAKRKSLGGKMSSENRLSLPRKTAANLSFAPEVFQPTAAEKFGKDIALQTDDSFLSTTYADATVQVVEADILRKSRKNGPQRQPLRETKVVEKTAGIDVQASATPTAQVTPDNPECQLLPLLPVPPELTSIGVNTDVNLTGFDVNPLPFLDAVTVRFAENSLVGADSDGEEASFANDGTIRHQWKGATLKEKQHGTPVSTKSSRDQLPDAVLNVFGLKSIENYRPHTVTWVNAQVLELLKHVDPFKMDHQKSTLAAWAFGHFRAKYGLGKMTVAYCLDFLGNLKLYESGSIRAHIFLSLLNAPKASEALFFYVFAVQAIARSVTYRSAKEFESAELLLPPTRIEQVCDAMLRNVAASMGDSDEWVAKRPSWHSTLLCTENLSSDQKRLATEIQVSRGKPNSLEALPSLSSATEAYNLPRNVSLDADVLCLLLLVNYFSLRRRIWDRANEMRRLALENQYGIDAVMDEKIFPNALPTESAPAADVIAAAMVFWPLEQSLDVQL